MNFLSLLPVSPAVVSRKGERGQVNHFKFTATEELSLVNVSLRSGGSGTLQCYMDPQAVAQYRSIGCLVHIIYMSSYHGNYMSTWYPNIVHADWREKQEHSMHWISTGSFEVNEAYAQNLQ